MRPIFTENTLGQVVTAEKVAIMLGVSTATIKNWVKCGHIRPVEQCRQNDFSMIEIENVKKQIFNGELEKLNKRANKSKAEKTFIPDEYVGSSSDFEAIEKIVDFISLNKIDTQTALLLLAINILQRKGVLSKINVASLVNINLLKFSNEQLKSELTDWLKLVEINNLKEGCGFLLNCHIPECRDFLGIMYQSLLAEGNKSKNGSYYTPKHIVDSIVGDYVSGDLKVLDPCCGTGQFLLSFAERIDDPSKIYGIDIDPTAVRIARFNILLFYKDKEFSPNIICKNTILDVGKYDLFSSDDENIKDFDMIATNPPWGLHFSKQDLDRLKMTGKEITSFESFSYFLNKSVDLLVDNGILSFILPESILNVRTHQDVRKILLKKTKILKISYLDRVFKNVFTPVIRLDIQKSQVPEMVEIIKDKDKYFVEQSRWAKNESNIFDIHVNDKDSAIIAKIYKKPHKTLRGNAEWALGVVTGDNKRYLVSEKKNNHEPIYKGKEVERFILNKPSNFIEFTPDKFQQVAPMEKYRAQEKLVYRFISKNLVFAYDDKQSLTLNSANIVIPMIKDYPTKVIAAFFNSSLYQFIFQKKFSTIKVLRSHLEQLPLPNLDETTIRKILKLVDEIILRKNQCDELDSFILDMFNLTSSEKEYVTNFNQ